MGVDIDFSVPEGQLIAEYLLETRPSSLLTVNVELYKTPVSCR